MKILQMIKILLKPVVYDGDGLDEDCADEVGEADVQ